MCEKKNTNQCQSQSHFVPSCYICTLIAADVFVCRNCATRILRRLSRLPSCRPKKHSHTQISVLGREKWPENAYLVQVDAWNVEVEHNVTLSYLAFFAFGRFHWPQPCGGSYFGNFQVFSSKHFICQYPMYNLGNPTQYSACSPACNAGSIPILSGRVDSNKNT